ncbi:hypothetical protein B0T25DRAFT_633845 [Lasiosphaeria hispida]|uniref:Cytochrome b5 heme-binding domain-containing protein n=1 Tax=Lasiosphaeria hispida TaxID=260671 RepID=A0AAJ0HB79_9PEZI|nr:hypothetical protein B0T25DRAFT_633845 [Lasiosphaeria hispida]
MFPENRVPQTHFTGSRLLASQQPIIHVTMSTTHYLGTAGDVGWDSSVPRDPDTPWRESFGGISDPTYARRGESAFAPQLPRIPNPIGMEYTPDSLGQLAPIPKPAGAEIDKLYLYERFQGLHNFGLRTWQLPSINHGLPPQGTLSVNEAGWHPAFRKDRWMEAVFFAKREDVKDNVPKSDWWANIPSSNGLNIPKVIDLLAPEHVAMNPQEEYKVYKESSDLSFYIHWTAFDKYDPDGYGHYNRSHGLAHGYTRVVYGRHGEWLSPFVAICLNTDNLNTLLHVHGTTPDQRAQHYMAQFQMASTMLKDEGTSELGLSGEKRLFGGTIRMAPTLLATGYTENSLNHYRPYALGIFQFPEDPFWDKLPNIYPDRWKDPQVTERFVIPTIYAANMEQERYWTDIVGKFGTNSIKVPRYLKVPVLQPYDMLRVWSARESTDKKWQSSPYSQIMVRIPISSFGEAVKQQDKKWAYAAMQELRNRLMYINKFAEDDPTQIFPHLNLFSALSILMGAVLPWEENKEMHQFTIQAEAQPNRWFPSQSAEHKTHFRFPDTWEPGPGSRDDYEWASGGPVMSAYYDRGPMDGREMTIQFGEQTVQSWVTLVPSHHALTLAVVRLAASLRQQVNDLRSNPQLDAHGWLRWDFEFPPYDPQLYLSDPHAKYTDPADGQVKEKSLWRKYDAKTRYTEDDTALLPSPKKQTRGEQARNEAEMTADWRRTRLMSRRQGLNQAAVEQEAQAYWASRKQVRQQTQTRGQHQPQVQPQPQWQPPQLHWPPQRENTYAPPPAQPVCPWPPGSQSDTRQLSAAAPVFVPGPESGSGGSQPRSNQPGEHRPGYGGFAWNDPPGGGQAKRATLVAKKVQQMQKEKDSERKQTNPVVFWTVGEVADHRSDTDRWVLLSDGQAGFDVFDVSGVSRLRGDRFTKKTTLTENGHLLSDEHAITYVQHQHDKLFRGKLLLEKELNEILEHDGEDGRRKWVYVGYDVFDITDFHFAGDEERQMLFSASRGFVGHITRHRDDLFARLMPYRCAKLSEPRTLDISLDLPKSLFTMKDISRRIFPGNGMATVINENVYQLGDWTKDFADFHPGGRQAIYNLAGRDATAEFISAHENWDKLLEKMDHIGYVVPERSLGSAIRNRDSEIQYGSIVYKMDSDVYVSGQLSRHFERVGTAQNQMEARAHFEQNYAELQRYLGINVTPLNDVASQRTLFASLLNVPELAVAYITSPPSRSVTTVELVENSDYRPLPGAETSSMAAQFRKVWVSIEETVYDVTDLARYGNDEIKEKVSSFGGRECTDPSLIHDIVACHVAPVVGKLVSEPTHQKHSHKKSRPLQLKPKPSANDLRKKRVKRRKRKSRSRGVA